MKVNNYTDEILAQQLASQQRMAQSGSWVYNLPYHQALIIETNRRNKKTQITKK